MAGEAALFWTRVCYDGVRSGSHYRTEPVLPVPQMTRIKLLNLGLLLIPSLVNLWTLGYFLGNIGLANARSAGPTTLAILVGAIPLHVYALYLAGHHLSQKNVAQHWATTVHMAVLLSVTWLCQAVFVILPDATIDRGNNDVFSPLPDTNWESRMVQFNFGLQPLLLLPALIVIVAVVPRGPKLYFPMEVLYTKQIIASLKEHYAAKGLPATSTPDPLNDRIPNVTPEVNCTIMGVILFLHVEPLLHKAKKATSFNVWDLPILQRNMRSMFAFQHIKSVYGDTRKLKRRQERHGIMGRIDKLPEGYNLLAKVFIANKGLFVIEIVLAAVTAGLYYLPAVFLQQLTQYLQDNPDRTNIRYGWMMCFGLATSNAIMYLAVGMLWRV